VRILLTGASSFTGYWFARELAAAGHHVVAPLRGAEGSYNGLRARRVRELEKCAEVVWASPFGEARFIDLIAGQGFDLLCHHAARVTDYRSPDFDVVAALAENTRELPRVLSTMRDKGLRGIVLTGSVFEAEEGAGNAPLRAFSPMGCRRASRRKSVVLVRGARTSRSASSYPESVRPVRGAALLLVPIKTWREGKAAEVRTPDYVRDNIHVRSAGEGVRVVRRGDSRQRLASRAQSERLCGNAGCVRAALRARDRSAPLTETPRSRSRNRPTFSEPLVRHNTSPRMASGWSESRAWDEVRRVLSRVRERWRSTRKPRQRSWPTALPLVAPWSAACEYAKVAQSAAIIRESGLFEEDWYLSALSAHARHRPVLHYLHHGAAEGLNPSRFFSTAKYLKNYPMSSTIGANPFLHYVQRGRLRSATGWPTTTRPGSRVTTR
jgi:NAD(P)-dependent dehydrogenase (short-subunit alcohol dehydrogenase family)